MTSGVQKSSTIESKDYILRNGFEWTHRDARRVLVIVVCYLLFRGRSRQFCLARSSVVVRCGLVAVRKFDVGMVADG
jgi:hypothetical protein